MWLIRFLRGLNFLEQFGRVNVHQLLQALTDHFRRHARHVTIRQHEKQIARRTVIRQNDVIIESIAPIDHPTWRFETLRSESIVIRLITILVPANDLQRPQPHD